MAAISCSRPLARGGAAPRWPARLRSRLALLSLTAFFLASGAGVGAAADGPKPVPASSRVSYRETALFYAATPPGPGPALTIAPAAALPRLDVVVRGEPFGGSAMDFSSAPAAPGIARSSLRLDLAASPVATAHFAAGLYLVRDAASAEGLAETRDLLLPFGLRSNVAPALDVGIGCRLRAVRQPGRATGFDEHVLVAGAQAGVSRSLTGAIHIGLADLRRAGAGGEKLPVFDAALTWTATPRTTYTVAVTRDFQSSRATAAANAGTAAVLRARHAISEFWSVETGVRYATVDYRGSYGGDFSTVELRFTYAPSNLVVLSGGYVFESGRSDRAPASSARGVLSVSASVRY